MKNTLRQPQKNCFLIIFEKEGSASVSEITYGEILDKAGDAKYEDFDDACDIAFKDGNYWLFETTENLINYVEERSHCSSFRDSKIGIAINNFLENWL